VFGNCGLTYSFSILNYWGVAQWYSTCLTFDPQYLKKRKEEEEERAHKALNLEKHTCAFFYSLVFCSLGVPLFRHLDLHLSFLLWCIRVRSGCFQVGEWASKLYSHPVMSQGLGQSLGAVLS
jgi:hypothetical protein